MNKTGNMMDYNEKVQYLKSYRDKLDQLTYIDGQILGVKAINYEASIGTRQSISQLYAKKDAIFSEMEKIEQTIDTLENVQERLVLKYLYIQLLPYDEVAERMKYSERHIRRLRSQAITNLEI